MRVVSVFVLEVVGQVLVRCVVTGDLTYSVHSRWPP